MATSNTPAAFLMRLACTGFGVLAVAWGVLFLPMFWREGPLDRLASRIAAGESFNPEVVRGSVANLASPLAGDWCRPGHARSVAVVNLYLLESANSEPRLFGNRLDELRRSLDVALSCAPADPFLWLVLYSADSMREGFHPRFFEFLRMSYRLGPNEGWIALKRNRVAVAVFDALPSDLADKVLAEFRHMIASGIYGDAADILAVAGLAARARLLAGLEAVPLDQRRQFVKVLAAKGYDMAVPGVDKGEARPWR